MNLLVQGIIPFILLSALNIKIYLQIQHLSRLRSIQDQTVKAKEVRHTQVRSKRKGPFFFKIVVDLGQFGNCCCFPCLSQCKMDSKPLGTATVWQR